VVLNHFTEGNQIQTCSFVRGLHKKFYDLSTDKFCFIAMTKSVTQNIRGVTERYYLSMESFPSKESDMKLLQSMYFERLLKAIQGMLGSCMRLLEQCLRTTFQQVTSHLPAMMSQPWRLLNQRNNKSLQNHCCSLVS